MKLIGSLLTTAVIVTAVWGVALLQLKPAVAADLELADNSAAVSKPPKKSGKQSTISQDNRTVLPIAIVGTTDRIQLQDIDALWQTFNDNTSLHQRLKTSPEKLYVIYQQFDKSYQQARVSIGYAKADISFATEGTNAPKGPYDTILEKAYYNKNKLAAAWSEIDYRRQVDAVVEVHFLNQRAESIATKLLVKYR